MAVLKGTYKFYSLAAIGRKFARQAGIQPALLLSLALVPIDVFGVGISDSEMLWISVVFKDNSKEKFGSLCGEESVSSHDNGSKRNDDHVVRVKKFEDMPEKDKEYVICGALFLAGLIFFYAYVAMEKWRIRKSKKKPRDGR